jgi:hypothetical protein
MVVYESVEQRWAQTEALPVADFLCSWFFYFIMMRFYYRIKGSVNSIRCLTGKFNRNNGLIFRF